MSHAHGSYNDAMSDSRLPRTSCRPSTPWISVGAITALLIGGFAALSASDGAGKAQSSPAPAASHDHHQHAAAAKKPAAPATASRATAAAKPGAALTFTGDRAETERFIAINDKITLTAAQEAIRVEALSAIPAPCCKEFSAATCCCECNMKRASDGLAKHLIVDLGADAAKVRSTVQAWQHAINPDGFEGDSCSTGKCGKPFKADGCGGMVHGQLTH